MARKTDRARGPGGADYTFARLARCLSTPKINVPTKSTIPTMANQSRPSNANPTIDSTTQATSKMTRTVHMFLTVRSIAREKR